MSENFFCIRSILDGFSLTLDPSKWRQRSRIVAVMALGLSVIGLLINICHWTFLIVKSDDFIIPTNNETLKGSNETATNTTNPLELFDYVRVVAFTILDFLTVLFVDVWASVLLLKATKIGTDPKLAMDRARNWRYITIVLTIFSGLDTAFFELYFLLALKIFFRGSFLYVVSQYIIELEKTIEATKEAGRNFMVVTT